jgi:hypothetical protein
MLSLYNQSSEIFKILVKLLVILPLYYQTLVKYLGLLSLKPFSKKLFPPPPPAFCPIFEILSYWMCIDKKGVRLPMTNVK